MKIERINPPGSTQPTAYTHLVRAGNTLYISGQVASNEKGELIALSGLKKAPTDLPDGRVDIRNLWSIIRRV
ncbi:hypothetical protein MYX82_10035 [Acidobacteria bacterium AH-259-D05]|nr:hypothetical protein [Acidobacteria bacterium AH-259-D05]